MLNGILGNVVTSMHLFGVNQILQLKNDGCDFDVVRPIVSSKQTFNI